ncbi:MAG: extradiol ring-cleavage dioxygenase, partial [Chromatiales bacterium]|nr:extradiol ring-cleavage dioxygenase [Chromatiales bacterium]
MIGDDQNEHLHVDNLPSVLLYHGATIRNTRAIIPEEAPAEERERIHGYYEPDKDVDYPVSVDLAEHLIEHLLDQHFDVASSAALPKARAEGHALQFAHRRLLPPDLPIVPVLLNTYVPPTQPRASRCYDLGAALANGIHTFAAPGWSDARIGVLASGGLSHFVVWESFDRALLDAFSRGDKAYLRELREDRLQSGTS